MTFKRMLGVSASALAYLALSAGPAAADPVTTFIVTTIGLTGTAAAVASFVINTALWTGAAHLVNKVIGPKNAGSGQARQADITSLSLGESPREMIVGRAVTGGSLVQGFNHGGQHGTDKETLVIAIADELCDGLEGVFVDDAFTAHTGDGDVAGTGGGLNIRWRNGAVGQTFPADLRALAGFDADDRLVGVAHVWVTYTAEWAQERGGRPRLRFRVRGGRRYDPRKDSTVPGGSGAHRWSNPATWQWTENLILNRYAYQRGVYCEGRVDEPDQLWVGRGLSEAEAPPERIIAWANLCDEAVALKGGGTEPRWRVGGVIRANETYIDVDEKFAAACGGTIIQPEGGIEVEPGHAKATVVHITDDDLIAGEPVQFNEFLPETERINTVVARYVDPSQDWQFHSAPVRRSTADVQADGGPYTSSPDLDLVTSGTQAQRVGEIIRRQGRLENRASFTLGPRFGWLERGDWISWTSARWLRGATKTFRITADPLDEGWRIRPQLEEVQAAVFGWTPATDEITPQTAPPDLWSKPGPLSLENVVVEVIDRGGVPGLRFTWNTPVDPAIGTVTVEARVKGEVQSSVSLTREPNSGHLDLTDGVAPATLMEARAWPAGSPDRDIDPSPWVEIGAGILRAGEWIDDNGDPIDPGDVINDQYAWTSRADYASFSALSLGGPVYTFANMTATPAGTPVGDEVRLVRTASGPYFQINNINLPGSDIREIKVRLFAAEAAWSESNWDGRLRYSTAGHSFSSSYEKAIPFPKALETVGKHVWAIWDMADLTAGGDDFLNNTITALRFYFHSGSADGLSLDVTYFGLGRTLPNGVTARGVRDNADQTATNTAAFVNGQGDLCTQDRAFATQVAFGEADNIVLDDDLEDPAFWIGNFTLHENFEGYSKNYLLQPASAAVENVYSQWMRVQPGEMLRVYVGDRPSSSDHTGYFSYIQFDNRAGTNFSAHLFQTTNAGASGRREATANYLVPDNVDRVRFRFRRLAGGTAGIRRDSPRIYRGQRLGSGLFDEGGAVLTNSRVITSLGRSAGVEPGAQFRQTNGFSTLMSGQPNILERGDGATITLSPAHAVTPQFTVLTDNFDAPLAGEYMRNRVIGASASGGTVQAQWVDPGSSPVYTARSDDGAGGLVGTPPAATLDRHKALSGAAYNGVYTYTGTARALVGVDVESGSSQGQIIVIAQGRRGPSDPWTEGGRAYLNVIRPGSGVVERTADFVIAANFAQWASWDVHGGTEYRVVATTQSPAVGTTEITAFTSVTYSEQTGGGAASSRPALSSGRQAKVVVTAVDG